MILSTSSIISGGPRFFDEEVGVGFIYNYNDRVGANITEVRLRDRLESAKHSQNEQEAGSNAR